MTHILSFLGHDGIRLLIFLFVIVGNMVKSQAKAAKNRDAQLRGGTAIRDFSQPQTPVAKPFEPASGASAAPRSASAPGSSAPGAASAPLTSPRPTASAAKPPAAKPPAAKPPASSQGSPWSSNQNPFG